MGWLVTLGILTLLAVLPLGVSVSYDASGALVRLIIGPLKITLFPRPKKDKKPKKAKKDKKDKKSSKTRKGDNQKAPNTPASDPANHQGTATKKKTGEKEASKEQKTGILGGGPITDFLPLVQILLDMLGAFWRRLRLNLLELKLIMAADDPCDLAVNYGRAWTAVGNLMPRLEKVFVIKKRNIEVECDFEASETKVIARLDLTITLGRILATVLVYGGKAGMEFMKIYKKRKGGALK